MWQKRLLLTLVFDIPDRSIASACKQCLNDISLAETIGPNWDVIEQLAADLAVGTPKDLASVLFLRAPPEMARGL